jgi:RNA polymerase sigma-70 factor, ECF subfamily
VHLPTELPGAADAAVADGRTIPLAAGGGTAVAFDFDTVFQAQYQRIARVIVRIVKDPGRAEDLAVETFWRLLQRPPREGVIEGWLHTTAVRLALDELRRRSRRDRYEQLFPFIRAPRTPHELFSSTQEQGRVRRVLAALPRRQAELLILKNENVSYEDISRALSVKPASVGVLLSRAREAFRKEYVNRYGQR